ncbi:hypothetical protein [Fangia hongkongensis]|nr:hypothetical protein [Fangia hongkongensis]MBK2124842.1 hypothetical protein [Fangia hongkongensis]
MNLSKLKKALNKIIYHDAATPFVLIALILAMVGMVYLPIEGLTLIADNHTNIFFKIVIGAVLLGLFIVGLRTKYKMYCRQNGITRGKAPKEKDNER